MSDNEDDQPGIQPIDGAHPVQLIDSTQVGQELKIGFRVRKTVSFWFYSETLENVVN
jgi:hypothetical protein